jgi:hypothetical protein
MPNVLTTANVVITAHQFNPSILSQVWLIKNRIVAEDEFLAGCMFSDMVTQAVTREFFLAVVPQQLQFIPNQNSIERQADLVTQRVGSLVKALPHTPYEAVGLNFVWQTVLEDEEEVPEFSKELFFVEHSALYEKFKCADAQFGAYMSKDRWGGRLKLDIKPIVLPVSGEQRLQFLFNYHRDVGQSDPVSVIGETLAHWVEARQESGKMVDAATGDQE